MNLYFNRLGRTLLVATVATLAAAGCSRSDDAGNGSKLAGEATFDPRPADQESIAAQLKRYPGQTKFLTPNSSFSGFRRETAAASAAGGDSRAIQESDVFKIGNAGDKLLFLLNNYRGLQVVSFEHGADEPKVVGRVEATGNWPSDMYFDAAHDRLIVLENNYSDNDSNYYDYSEMQSRLVVYDVADATKPRIAATIDLQGTLGDSRLVGNILYVASSVRPAWNAASQDGSGHVQSFALNADAVTPVESLTLSAPVAYGETMNIVETGAEGAKQYYLIAVLSQDVWSWWDRQSLVEVVDISDATGDIRPVMQVTTRGVVRERSQTHVKDGALIVASNYVVGDTNIQRIAVETFSFPQADQLITKNEAEFRRLYIERAESRRRTALTAQGLSGDALSDALATYRAALQNDNELGLSGRFVSSADGLSPVKLLPDHAVTVGHTQGLSANIQDVRVEGSQLYVFWVPANNIDPLDIFDISAPQTSLRHVAHLEFDGWIQRAMPVTYAGKNYILGLGWVIPSIDNDNSRRYPQVALFEVKTNAQTQRVSAALVAQKNLGDSNTWANFNGSDKDIEFRFDSEAAGVIMYTFYGWADAGYTQGGKLIGFDLSQAETNADAVFTEGGILAGGDGWLRRVFTNPEISRVNTFADTALGVYDIDGIGAANRTVAATKILELARNLRGYATITTGDHVQGVQIVSDYGWSYEDAKTELRLVDANRADADLDAAVAKLMLPGYFVDQAVDRQGRMVVLTNANKRTVDGEDVSYTEELTLSVVTLNATGTGFNVAPSSTWSIDSAAETPFQYDRRLVTLVDGRIVAVGAGLKLINAGTISSLTLSGCAFDQNRTIALKILNGQLLVSYAESVIDPSDERLSYARHFIAPANVSATELTCGAAVNVPGEPLLVRDGQIVTQDTRLLEIVRRGEDEDSYPEVITDDAVASLSFAANSATATLVDLYDPKNVTPAAMHTLGDDRLVFIESKAKPLRFGWFDGFRSSMPRASSLTNMDHRFVFLGFDNELRFTKTSYTVGEGQNAAPQVNAVLAPLTAGEDGVAVVTQGSQLKLLSLSAMTRPTLKNMAKIGSDFSLGEPTTSLKLTGYSRYWLSAGELCVTKIGDVSTLALVDGLFGITQIVITQ